MLHRLKELPSFAVSDVVDDAIQGKDFSRCFIADAGDAGQSPERRAVFPAVLHFFVAQCAVRFQQRHDFRATRGIVVEILRWNGAKFIHRRIAEHLDASFVHEDESVLHGSPKNCFGNISGDGHEQLLTLAQRAFGLFAVRDVANMAGEQGLLATRHTGDGKLNGDFFAGLFPGSDFDATAGHAIMTGADRIGDTVAMHFLQCGRYDECGHLLANCLGAPVTKRAFGSGIPIHYEAVMINCHDAIKRCFQDRRFGGFAKTQCSLGAGKA